jgi:Beta-lactamase enzyme family
MTFYITDEPCQRLGDELVRFALTEFGAKGLEPDKLALTLLVHDKPLGDRAPLPRGFGYRAAQPFYPCSVIKVFYLVAAQARLEDGFIRPHEELDRAMRDMILYSSNAGTNYVIDLVTGTTGDTLLAEAEMAEWANRRNWVNRFFRGFGWPEFSSINVCQKLMDDLRYGRERQFLGVASHNRLTTDATARLFHAIMTGRVINAQRSGVMADHLRRPLDPDWIAAEPASQVRGYFGEGLPPGSRLWSKAGWTTWIRDSRASYRRHDAAYIELPGGRAFTLVVFSQGPEISANSAWLPAMARRTVELLG